jgi:hypothetical protein
VRLQLFWIQYQVISINFTLRLYDGIDQTFLGHFDHFKTFNMGIKLSKFNVILTNFRDRFSGFEIVFEGLKSFGIGFVGLKIHIFCKDNIFGYFRSNFIEISIIK